MHARKPSVANGAVSFILVFDSGDELTKELLAFARERSIDAASFTGTGAFQQVTLGFEVDRCDYRRIPVDEQVEVVSLVGNIASGDDGPKLHAHVRDYASDRVSLSRAAAAALIAAGGLAAWRAWRRQ